MRSGDLPHTAAYKASEWAAIVIRIIDITVIVISINIILIMTIVLLIIVIRILIIEDPSQGFYKASRMARIL